MSPVGHFQPLNPKHMFVINGNQALSAKHYIFVGGSKIVILLHIRNKFFTIHYPLPPKKNVYQEIYNLS